MRLYDKIFKIPWPYWVGGVLLAALNILLFMTTGRPWKISTGFLHWSTCFLHKIGIDPYNWHYFNSYNNIQNEISFYNYYTILIFGIILGSLIATLLSSEFSLKKIKNKRQLFFGFLGGILMGYGTRLSFGCNIGAFFSAIPSMSLHGWVFGIFMFVGAWIGSKILIKYIL